MLDPIGIIKIAETKGVAMIDRFSKLYKESAVRKAKKPLKQTETALLELKLQKA